MTVISPHLDDAALSVGATVAHTARCGGRVRILTVFSGNPDSTASAQPWDLACGFRTEGDATVCRRGEDERACAILGAVPVWLPFAPGKEGSSRKADIAAAIATAIEDEDVVLIPSFPLVLPEHRLVTELALAALRDGVRVGFYVDQPYAVWELFGPLQPVARWHSAVQLGLRRKRGLPGGATLGGTEGAVFREGAWTSLPARPVDWLRKARAIHAYESQLAGLGRALFAQIALYDWSCGGEQVQWVFWKNDTSPLPVEPVPRVPDPDAPER